MECEKMTKMRARFFLIWMLTSDFFISVTKTRNFGTRHGIMMWEKVLINEINIQYILQIPDW